MYVTVSAVPGLAVFISELALWNFACGTTELMIGLHLLNYFLNSVDGKKNALEWSKTKYIKVQHCFSRRSNIRMQQKEREEKCHVHCLGCTLHYFPLLSLNVQFHLDIRSSRMLVSLH
jgi:hypothetical protein